MKKKILFLAFVVIASVSIFNFYNSPLKDTYIPYQPQPNNGDKFLIGCVTSYCDFPYHNNYEALGLNITHRYLGTAEPGQWHGDPYRHTPVGWASDDDYLNSTVPFDGIRDIMNVMYQHNQSRFMWMRPKIEWLCYGQSSIYQAEWISPNDDYWFYAFQLNSGESMQDYEFNNGDSVLHCGMPTGGPNAKLVLSRLKANTEQCRKEETSTSNQWQADNECRWFIKPKIRIPANYPDSHRETPICSIAVIKQDGSIFKSVVLKGINFLDVNYNYDGRYLEEYLYLPDSDSLAVQGAWGSLWGYEARGNRPEEQINNHADVQVYWYDNCDMWIDYVKVENDVANDLLSNNPLNPKWVLYNQWITDEVNAVKDPLPGLSEPAVYNFYIELFEFNNIPCMAYVNQKIQLYSYNKIGLMADQLTFFRYHVPWENVAQLFDASYVVRTYVNTVGSTQVFGGHYPFTTDYYPPSTPYSKIPNTLPLHQGDKILAGDVSPEDYDAWLQMLLDTACSNVGQVPGDKPNDELIPMPPLYGYYMATMKICNKISKEANIPFNAWGQAHQLVNINPDGETEREPTAEESDLLANIPVSYGAKGIIYYGWESNGNPPNQNYQYGLTEGNMNNVTPRTENVYLQPKWTKYQQIFQRLKTWETYTMSFDNRYTNSYIYRLENERNDLINNSYFFDVVTYKPGFPPIDCTEDDPGGDLPPNLIYECKHERYVQVATFQKNITEIAEYFMIVNRRCSPHFEPGEDPRYPTGENGGSRDVRVRFQASHLPTNLHNWRIIDLGNPDWSISFDKTQNAFVDLNWFKPGEGRLYKMIPVVIGGGTLQGDEAINDIEFTCLDTVYSNGHNITIGSGTAIHFTDSSTFIMNGGTIQIGDPNYIGTPNVNLGAASGNHWKGLDFNNCTVKIYNTAFSGVSNDTSYAINTIDCPFVDIQKNTFNCDDNLKGAINLTYYSIPKINNAYIGGNTISVNSSAIPAFNILSYAGITVPLIVENNTLTSNSALGSTAIMLSGITGGAVKNNTITNYERSINALSSSLDISGNTITSDVSSSKGISGLAGTELKMNNSGDLFLGGQNTFTNTGSSSMNLYVEDSYFLIDNGENIFDITDGLPSYHLNGYFPVSDSIVTDARLNCFKINYSPATPPVQDVTWGTGGEQVTFTFEPYLTGCSTDGGGDFVIYLGGGLNDTITQRSGGGGEPGYLPLAKVEDPTLGVGEIQRGSYMILTPKQMYDSICIQMRFRNYGYVKNRCMDLINAYPDSIQSLNAIPKLYLSSTSSDTSHSGISALKTYYETLILNNPNNTALVNRCNYFVQKCKVRLRQYSSAMAGFQQIINNNPYSYEALVAKWDYMATHLLDSLSGGGEPGDGEGPHDKFTKEQRQTINTSIGTAQLDSKIKEEKKIEILSVLANTGNSLAAAELKVKKTLKEVSKPQSPHTIMEHIKIVNNDIQKVFGNPNMKSKNENNLIPNEFRLSQNYPNPFNPVTKIQYDLPKDVKVKLIIYDILGREVIRLVNNEFKQAGRYTVEFNGNNYASGVYFYRFEADKFVQSKKMVLLK